MKTSWKRKKLGEVCEIVKGRKPLLEQQVLKGYLPYLEAKVMRGSKEPQYAAKTDKNSILVDSGEIIIICDGSNSGEIFTGYSGVLSSTMGKIKHSPEIDNRYLKIFLSSTFEIFNGSKTGSAIPHLDKDALYELGIPLPPLGEQKRIVDILDKVFSVIDKVKENTEKNLKNSRELFENQLEILFNPKNESGLKKTLGDVCDLYQGLAINVKSKHLLVPFSNLPLLRIKDLRNGSAEQFVMESGFPPNARVSESEIIYTRTGQIGLVFRGRAGVLHNNCFKIKPKQIIDNGYLFWWLQNPNFRNRITKLALRAAQPDITHVLFKAESILLPSLNYQAKTVVKIECHFKEMERLHYVYRHKIDLLEILKRSILQKAFAGDLIGRAS